MSVGYGSCRDGQGRRLLYVLREYLMRALLDDECSDMHRSGCTVLVGHAQHPHFTDPESTLMRASGRTFAVLHALPALADDHRTNRDDAHKHNG